MKNLISDGVGVFQQGIGNYTFGQGGKSSFLNELLNTEQYEVFETEDRNVLSYGQIEVFIDNESNSKLVFMDPTGAPLANAVTSTL